MDLTNSLCQWGNSKKRKQRSNLDHGRHDTRLGLNWKEDKGNKGFLKACMLNLTREHVVVTLMNI